MSARIVCPVDGCEWTYAEPEQAIDQGTLASVFGPGVYAAVTHNQRLKNTEHAVKVHMDGHTPEQFLRTITRLNGLVDDLSRALEYMEVKAP